MDAANSLIHLVPFVFHNVAFDIYGYFKMFNFMSATDLFL